MLYDVALCGCSDYSYENCSYAVRAAFDAVGGDELIYPGCRVVIKANLVSALKPEKAATTHPALLGALSDLLYEKGASVVIGDSPGGIYSPPYMSRVYSATRLTETEEHHALLNRDFGVSEALYEKGVAAKRFKYTSYLDNADVIINFCKLKTHGMMGMSAGVKNMFGVIPGTMKPEYHYKYPDPDVFVSMLIDLNEFFHPALTFCDAVECMEGNGPTAGNPRHMGALIASRSQYQLDAVCAQLIGVDPLTVRTVACSVRRGLLDPDLSAITVSGDVSEFELQDFDTSVVSKNSIFDSSNMNFGGKITGKLIKFFVSSKPAPDKSECIGCKKCFEICPANAVTMKNNKPKIDRGKCIKCFCCQEFCPVGAMKVKRSLVARLLQK